MNLLPDFIKKDRYLKSKKLLREANIARKRAWLIANFSVLNLNNDFHGAIEAAQHCFELSLKALWILYGFEYPRDHNPAKDLDNLLERMFTVFPELKDYPIFEKWITWVKAKGPFIKKLHESSIYGDEKKMIYASDLFSEEKMFEFLDDAELSYQMSLKPIRIIGDRLELLTEKEKKELDFSREFVKYLIRIPGGHEILKKISNKKFKNK